ncbi:MAG TPA: hypothetical protein VIF62_19500 [Labilithrix sp.]
MAADVYRIAERIAPPLPPSSQVVEGDLDYVNCAAGVPNPWMAPREPWQPSRRASYVMLCSMLAVVGIYSIAVVLAVLAT